MATRTLLTADDLLKLPKDGKRYELLRGELITMTPPGARHGWVAARITYFLQRFLAEDPQGVVLNEAGFLLHQDPDTVRAPDVAFIAKSRLQRPLPSLAFGRNKKRVAGRSRSQAGHGLRAPPPASGL
ncbi:MAG TPA: Uma2 family endonuclease [Firmicutes bacterium]|nr:Uma2 family endonuclease [Bacillota bacterium]